jgi:hypothetical protein
MREYRGCVYVTQFLPIKKALSQLYLSGVITASRPR